jgi:hypothetical protein
MWWRILAPFVNITVRVGVASAGALPGRVPFVSALPAAVSQWH